MNCGYVEKRGDAFYFKVGKFEGIYKIIIPFFQNYKIQGVKSKDFEYFCKVAMMIKETKH